MQCNNAKDSLWDAMEATPTKRGGAPSHKKGRRGVKVCTGKHSFLTNHIAEQVGARPINMMLQ